MTKNTLSGTFVYEDMLYPVTVTKNSNVSITVEPHEFEGYAITFSDEGSKVFFNGMEFESEGNYLSRFAPLWDMVRDVNTTVKQNEIVHSSGCLFRGFE